MDIQAHVRAFRGERWAVRSSGAAEDGANESLAGRYLSILDVDSGSIPTAVGGVRESARVEDDVTIPVLTQVMIDPVCAGVAFTADPITGNRDETIVVGARGVAERLLSGETQGDEWRVAGARAKPVRQPEGVLDSKLVRRVARVAADIAREFDAPQDIEWAWDGKELWVIQARPSRGCPTR